LPISGIERFFLRYIFKVHSSFSLYAVYFEDQPSKTYPVSFGKPKVEYGKRTMEETTEKGKIGK